jgi:hypothetical protein
MTARPPSHGNDCATFDRYTSSMIRWTLRYAGSVHASRTGTPSVGSPYSACQASFAATMTSAAPTYSDMIGTTAYPQLPCVPCSVGRDAHPLRIVPCIFANRVSRDNGGGGGNVHGAR